MATLDLLVVAAYLVGMVALGFSTQRRAAASQEQFLVAGRSVGPLLYSGTLAAIIIGGGATVGGVKLGYTYGLSGMWLVSMYGLGMIVMGLLLVPRILKLELYTVAEILQRRFGPSARIAGGVVMGCYDFMIVVVATISLGAVAEVMTGVPRTEAILLCSAVMIGYSVLGGMWALTATDIVQFVIKTVGILFILLPVAVWRAGGLGGMQAALPEGFFSLTHIGWDRIAAFVTLYFLGILIGQDGWQRVFTARSVAVARTGGVLVGMYCILYAAAGALIGAAGRTFLPDLADADLAFAAIVNAVLPVGLRGLVLAASLAAIMSTATACLLATSTVFLEDVYLTLKGSGGSGTVTQTRLLTLVLGVIAALVACVMHDVIAALTVGYNLLVGAIFVPIIAAMLLPRGVPEAALVSIVASAIMVIVLMFFFGIDSVVPIYGGLATSVALFFGITLVARSRVAARGAEVGIDR
ncbi:MAG: solute symporter family protein [Steroidobacteraceae bacterium]|nr:solute symporter family protein [Steroidobacteraceae bacterium]